MTPLAHPGLETPQMPTGDTVEDHWTCCDDGDLTLCGTRDPGMPETDFAVASCVVCEDLVDTHFCPRTSALTCPLPADAGHEEG